ncbi:MAG: cytochrome c, partial [Bacteroidia bacterium]|nr:cytochrome c [Bacteroidia bacterium]
NQLEAIERGEIVPLSGGHLFDIPPGKIYTPNITSDVETGIGGLPDSVIARSLRYGVGHDGRAMPDFMPFQHLSDEDLVAIISYLRSTAAVKNAVPKTEWNVMGNVIKALVLEPVGPTTEVPKTVTKGATVEYGKYLVESVANCKGCHTDRDLKTGKFTGIPYAGGFRMPSDVNPAMFVVTPNITSDAETGRLAKWTEDEFIERFRKGKIVQESTMPWGPFSRLADTDLRAIYRFLKSIPPVRNNTGPVLVSMH